MKRRSIQTSAGERSRWLMELADALEDAQKLAWQLGGVGHGLEAMELYGRLEAARLEVQSLRFRAFRMTARQFDPGWTDLAPWNPEEIAD